MEHNKYSISQYDYYSISQYEVYLKEGKVYRFNRVVNENTPKEDVSEILKNVKTCINKKETFYGDKSVLDIETKTTRVYDKGNYEKTYTTILNEQYEIDLNTGEQVIVFNDVKHEEDKTYYSDSDEKLIIIPVSKYKNTDTSYLCSKGTDKMSEHISRIIRLSERVFRNCCYDDMEDMDVHLQKYNINFEDVDKIVECHYNQKIQV